MEETQSPVLSARQFSSIERDGLQERCSILGARLLKGRNTLMDKYDTIGDVRGKGLMVAIELVEDRQTKVPAKEHTTNVLEAAKDYGLLIGKGSLDGNIIITPPMCVNEADIDFIVDVLDYSLAQTETN